MEIIQVLLILGFIVLFFLTRKQISPHTKFIGRLGFALIAINFLVAILFPELITRLALSLGVGRGTDLIVYISIFGLLGLASLVLAKFRKIESDITNLVRRLAVEKETSPLKLKGDE